MKRAFIVCGPEHSGNRLVAGLLVSGGCWGRGSTFQPRPSEVITAGADKVVVIAHLHEDVKDWVDRFRFHDYDVHVVVTARDPWVQVRSRSKAANCQPEESMDRYWSDYRAAFTAIIESDSVFTVIPYESLLWKGAAKRFLSLFGLEQAGPLVVNGEETTIRDENGKWLEGA